jgi:3-ketosteroid 9alpha-monooxygenase subunit B
VTNAEAKVSPPPLQKWTSTCVDVVRNTYDTVTLHFDIGQQPAYTAGQFISIDPHQFAELSRQVAYFEHVKGKRETFRAYSMSSAPTERTVSITVKAEGYDAKHDKYPPLLSPFLASESMKGRAVLFTGFTGPYVLPAGHDQQTKQVIHLVAGSGIVPNYALLKDELLQKKHPSVKHTMIYVNKTEADVIFMRELEELHAAHADRFELLHLWTRDNVDGRGPRFRSGRPTADLLRSVVQDPKTVLVYACGAAVTKWQRNEAKVTGVEPTPRFMEGVTSMVEELGIDEERFFSEEYG